MGERYLDACVERRDAYGGGSVMMVGITARHKADVVFVDGRLTGVMYCDSSGSSLYSTSWRSYPTG